MPIRTTKLREMKQAGERIVCVTAYDFPTARLVQEAGFEVVLVGDSLGNVVLGYDSTIPVTMDDVLHHTRAVARGAPGLLVVADMPFMTFNVSAEEALRNAGRLLQEGGAHAVKLEGGLPVAGTVRRLTEVGIPATGCSVGSMWGVFFSQESVHSFEEAQAADLDTFRAFHRACLDRGVFLAPSPFEAGFVSTAHIPGVIDETLEVVREASREVAALEVA